MIGVVSSGAEDESKLVLIRIVKATLIRLGYDDSSKPSFGEPRLYGKYCPSDSDPMPDHREPSFF